MKIMVRGLFEVLLRDIRRGIEEIQNSNPRLTKYKEGILIISRFLTVGVQLKRLLNFGFIF
jgi:hypothetical protein